MTTAAIKPGLKPLEAALAELLAHAQPLDRVEMVDAFDGDGRVLAQDVVAEIDVPGFDNSQMDGYAVRAADVRVAGQALPVSQRIAAGHFGVALAVQSCARIFTGAPMPLGADSVLMQEDCAVVADGVVQLNVVPEMGQWVRLRGEDVRRGQGVLQAGTVLGPAQIGLAASLGVARLSVRAAPVVAMFSTGDELVMPGSIAPQDLPKGAIFNSNRYFLRTLLERLGATVRDMGVVPDTFDATIQAMRTAALDADLILTSGGVSVGEEDHVKPAVQALGELDLWQISMKPGKPFAYGRVRRGDVTGRVRGHFCHFIGLPGNPVSSFVTALLLVRPFLQALLGLPATPLPTVDGVALHDGPPADKRREFLRATSTPQANGQLGVAFFPNQNSSVLTSMHWANALVDNPSHTSIRAGDTVQIIDLAALMR